MKKMKIGLIGCLMTAYIVGVTGCASYGTSYEKHYTNQLSCGPQTCDSNGVPNAPVVNGSESYEHHYSYDINPIVWLGTGLKLVLGCGHTDNEVVVCAPAYRCSPQPTQYQGSVGYQYYSQPNYSGYVQHGYSTVYGLR